MIYCSHTTIGTASVIPYTYDNKLRVREVRKICACMYGNFSEPIKHIYI